MVILLFFILFILSIADAFIIHSSIIIELIFHSSVFFNVITALNQCVCLSPSCIFEVQSPVHMAMFYSSICSFFDEKTKVQKSHMRGKIELGFLFVK